MIVETAFEPLSFFEKVAAVLPEPPPDGRLIGKSSNICILPSEPALQWL